MTKEQLLVYMEEWLEEIDEDYENDKHSSIDIYLAEVNMLEHLIGVLKND